MMSMTKWLSVCAAAGGLIALAGCGGGGSDSDGGDFESANEVEEMTYDVVYDDAAVVVEGDAMADVLSVSEDGKTVRVAGGSGTAESLEKGTVVLFAENAFGKVESLSTDGDEVVVNLGEATLNELIRDGEISWKDDIRWDEMSAVTLSRAFVQAGFVGQEATPEPTLPVPKGLKFSGKFAGWDVSIELKPTSDRLNMDLSAKYGEAVAVTGKGFISNFTEETLLKFEDSQFGEAAVRTTELETEMELTWHAFRRNNDEGLTEVAQFTLPVSLPIPFFIGPIPFQFSVKAGLQVVPAFEAEASSGGSWKVNYKSSQGFKVDNTLGGAIGEMTGAQIDTTDQAETVTSSLGPAGFAVGIEFPRFELAIFGEVAMAFVTLKTYSAGLWTPGTTLTADIAPCQSGFTEVSATYGYKLGILGGVGIEAESDIWKQRVNKFLDDPCSIEGGDPPQDTLDSGPGENAGGAFD
jgi:hypothetical protein